MELNLVSWSLSRCIPTTHLTAREPNSLVLIVVAIGTGTTTTETTTRTTRTTRTAVTQAAQTPRTSRATTMVVTASRSLSVSSTPHLAQNVFASQNVFPFSALEGGQAAFPMAPMQPQGMMVPAYGVQPHGQQGFLAHGLQDEGWEQTCSW